MASTNDVLSAAQNIAIAINNATQTYLSVNGASVATGLTAATLVKASAGRVCTVSVVTAGSAAGRVYDATNASLTANPVFTIPTTVGSYVVNIPTLFGIVVAPGTGQTITVSFS